MRFPSRAFEHRRAAGALAVFGMFGSGFALAVGGIGFFRDLHGSASAVPAVFAAPVASAVVLPEGPTTPVATTTSFQTSATPAAAATYPTTLQIPSIRMNASMELLGLASDGTLQTPRDVEKAGWFTGSSLPGEPGPVVIAGHVDSTTGPAVFVHLKDLKPGDPITITLTSGRRVGYQVTSVVTYAKNQFPSQSVYGPRPDSELRLITCGGAFVNGQYVDDVVVSAKLSAQH